jgi:hypothetical protein
MKAFLFLIFPVMLYASSARDMEMIRRLYYEASEKRDSADKFLHLMKDVKIESSALLLCYKGMANMIQAHHSFNPYHKLSYFNKGKALVEKAILIDPQDVEIRFLRFCVQTNAPFFLRYNSDILPDKAIILKGWGAITDLYLKEKIKSYMLKSTYCTMEEKSNFK